MDSRYVPTTFEQFIISQKKKKKISWEQIMRVDMTVFRVKNYCFFVDCRVKIDLFIFYLCSHHSKD